jgi:plasmid stabilization system protein ParE
MAILWSREGADDFLTALAYLRERSPAAAERLAARVNETLQKLVDLSDGTLASACQAAASPPEHGGVRESSSATP